MLNVMLRDDGMNEILMPKQHAENDAEREFVLRLLANRIAAFFHSLIVVSGKSAFKDGANSILSNVKSSYLLDSRHLWN